MKARTPLMIAALTAAGAGAAFAQLQAHPSARTALPRFAAAAAEDDGADRPRDRAVRPSDSRTWLGVSTRPIPPIATRQLGLGAGIGLEVLFVAPESPAGKAGLAEQDVLVRFEDQTLVNQEQLAVLVRQKSAGDEVELTVYRDGKEMKLTATLERTKHVERPVLDADRFHRPGWIPNPIFPRAPRNPAWDDRDLDRLFEQRFDLPEGIKEKIRDALDFEIKIKPGKGFRQKSFSIRNQTYVLSNEQGSVTVTSENGRRHVVVKDPEGKTTYEGDFKSVDELPKDVRDRLAPLNLGGEGQPAAPEADEDPMLESGKKTEV